MSRAFVFPGQGSQSIGMGQELAENFTVAKEVFQEVDDALGQNLYRLITDGPDTDLNMTETTQPALMAVSVAVARVLEHEGGFRLADKARFTAGHSLGEYSALTAFGAITLADSARILRARGQAMQSAVPAGQGGMAAVIGLEFSDVETVTEAAADGEICTIANDNGGGQLVISGHAGAVARAVDIAKDKGAKRCVVLPVSAPFHCPLMAPAAQRMEDVLAEIDINKPALPVIANVTAESVEDPDMIRQLLVQQVTGQVRWRETVMKMKDLGVEALVETGAGKVLSGLARRIDRSISTVALSSPSDIDAFLQSL